MATTTYGTPYVSGTDLVANWPAASLTVADSIDAAGYYIGRGINAQTVSYQTVITDAGKTISMTAAGATTLTIPANSSVAYVVGTRINILNLGAGACTPTAGAGVTINGTITALATNESASLVKTATNTWSYLVAATPATPGLSLVTPTSVAGTGVTLSGGQVTITTATTASVNGCFTSTYDNYLIQLAVTSTSATLGLNLRMRAAGSDNSSINYGFSFTKFTYTGTFTTDNNSDAITYFAVGDAATGQGCSSQVALYSPALTVKTTYVVTCASSVSSRFGGGQMSVTTAYDGFTLYPSTGNFTGTLRVYGLRNS